MNLQGPAFCEQTPFMVLAAELGDIWSACHALELPFVFDNLQQNEHQALTGPGAPQAVADAMHAAWVAFATSGDPGWPRYDLTRRATMRFNLTSEVVDDPHAAERVFWEGRR